MSELSQLEIALEKINESLQSAVAKANAEATNASKVSEQSLKALENLTSEQVKIVERMAQIEQSIADNLAKSQSKSKSLAKAVVDDSNYKAYLAGQSEKYGRVFDLRSENFDITEGGGSGRPLTTPHENNSQFYNYGFRKFKIQDLVTKFNTISDVYKYTRIDTVTDNTGVQYASGVREGIALGESNITFTRQTATVETIGHLMELSDQVLEDSELLQSNIDFLMSYFVDKKVETQMLVGTGTGQLSGITASGNFTTYSRGVTGDDAIKTLRRMITQVQLNDYEPSGFVLNPADWEKIQLLSQDPAAMRDRTVVGDVNGGYIHGLPVVVTNSMTAGTALCGDFRTAHLVDRNQVRIDVATQHSTNFAALMVALRGSRRLAFAVTSPKAFTKATI